MQILLYLLLLFFFFFFIVSDASSNNNFDYHDALEKSILFYEGQRSGPLPPDQRLDWRGDSGMQDGKSARVDLVGGYYDAGDNIKFGLPMAFTITLLSWSVLEYRNSMGDQGGYAEGAIRWGTDYLLKAAAHIDYDILYVQVGNPNQEHQCWVRPEDMDSSKRPVYSVTAQQPGSDVAGETAAALAAASIVFRKKDTLYSKKLLSTAEKVFKFADKYKGSYSANAEICSAVCPFYQSYSGFGDELLWAASWLYIASRNGYYFDYYNENREALGNSGDENSFSWDDKRPGTSILLSNLYLLSGRKKDLEASNIEADKYVCDVVYNKAQHTSGGLYYKQDSSNLQYVTASTFLVLNYAKYLKRVGQSPTCGTADELIEYAKKQVDYILGDNPAAMSYMVGYGNKYPLHVHHRGASIPSVKQQSNTIGCDESARTSESPNPNLLVGAVVGGPNHDDQFSDKRDDFSHSEPATYINAPLVGLLAYFSHQP